jgi:hypothetical protein
MKRISLLVVLAALGGGAAAQVEPIVLHVQHMEATAKVGTTMLCEGTVLQSDKNDNIFVKCYWPTSWFKDPRQSLEVKGKFPESSMQLLKNGWEIVDKRDGASPAPGYQSYTFKFKKVQIKSRYLGYSD